ncbi:MAG: GNAT family N-acetyltransferase [Pseudonocardiales bacterium]|nr:GNAT family N-acetyltransferase [Pseudonocardiales bacterium]
MHTLSQALKFDLEGIQQLDAEVYGEDAYSYMILRQFLDVAGELFLVCKDGRGHVVAYGIIVPSVSQGSGWLLSLVVGLSHRRKGIGTALVNQLLDKATLSSLEKIYLTVAPGNHSALSLYGRLGFATMEVEHHYFGPNKDRIIMCRSLGVQTG